MKLYREVKASERLPESTKGVKIVTTHHFSSQRLMEYDLRNRTWLEAYEVHSLKGGGNLPPPPVSKITEEEIEEMAIEYSEPMDRTYQDHAEMDFKAGAKAILKALKGE